MENNNNTFKFRLSKLFQSSFNSCRTKHISDVVDQPFFFPENHHHRQLIQLFSPKPQPLSCKPTPLSPFHQNKPKPSKKKKAHHRKPIKLQDFSSVTDNYYYDCCSSDEDDNLDDEDEATLFSSRSFSFSSDSSLSFKKNRTRRKKTKKVSGVSGCKDRKATDVIPIKCVGKLVKDSVAVVKKSSDPHEDFRVSMMEMIVERQILGVQDLEDLLECFLTLNSEQHHEIICEVFTEIWETLFSDWL